LSLDYVATRETILSEQSLRLRLHFSLERSDSKSLATNRVLPAVCGLLRLIRYRLGGLLTGRESPAEVGAKRPSCQKSDNFLISINH
jgi:hypothetical protein